ncbi:hypothetical protein FV139_07265 [Parahaliea maris]|uniref:Translocation and assembly module TamB C-terminal domain-containing protein n=1 Tax=Parahaliea maris TaxID=2716870 RepID=A0A5C9A7M1_9GAMM|nr:translocation/assembly module TamB domain-containing protein [Parahaliea maris]TXS95660.1 hypothetical protein FV139_07265 [Parahaliea maris]
MKRLLTWLPMMLVLVIGLFSTLPFTQSGSRAVVQLVDSYTPLDIEFTSGRLFGTFALGSVRLASEGLTLELEGVEAALRPVCLVQAQLCFDGLSVAALRVTAAASGEAGDDADEDVDTTPLVFPLRVLAPELQVANTRIEWDGGSWSQGRTLLGVVVETTGIYITRGRVREARLALESGSEADAGRTELPALWLPFELAVDQLELVRPGWSLAGQAGSLDRISLRGRWQQDRLEVEQATAARAAWGQLELGGELQFAGNWPLEARLSAVPDAELPGIAALQPGPLSLSAGGDLAALKLSLNSAGPRRLQVRGTLDTLAGDLPFDAQARLEWDGELTLGSLLELPPELGPVQLQAPLSVSAKGNLDRVDLLLAGVATGLGYQDLALILEGQWQEDLLRVDSLSAREPGEQGSTLLATGSLGLGAETALDLHLATPGLTLPNLSEYLFGRVDGELALSGRFSDQGWAVDLQNVELSGEVNGLPASAAGHVQLDSEQYLAGGQLAFAINDALGTLEPVPGSQDSRLHLRVGDLGRWQPGSRGALDLVARLQSRAQRGSFELSAEELGWQDLRLEQGTASGRFDLEQGGSVVADIALQEIQQGELTIYRSDLALTASSSRMTLDWQSSGDLEGLLSLQVAREGDAWRGSLAATELQTPVGAWTLADSAGFTWKDDTLTVDAHCWQAKATELCLRAGRFGKTGEFSLALAGDAGLLARFAAEGVQVEGDLNGDIRANWTETTPLQVEAVFNLEHGLLSQRIEDTMASWSWDLLRVEARSAQGNTAIDAILQRDQRDVLALQATLDGNQGSTLSGRLQLHQLDLAALRPFVPQLVRLEGSLDGELELAGSATAPEGRGSLWWRQGALQLLENPTAVEDLNLRLDVLGDRVLVDGRGLLGGGELAVNGTLRGLPDWSLELAIEGRKNRLVYPPSLEVVVSPELQVSARADLVSLSGRIAVEEGLLEQDQLPEGSVELSPDVVRVDYAGNVLEDQQPFDTSIDLRLAIADKFRVLGSGLDATVGGDLEVRQRPGSPLQLYGNLNVVGGEFRAYGQHLKIRQGRVSFAGVPDNPELDLRAEREISLEQVTAGVRVSGTLDEPALQVYTDPAMSQAEALSYLVRGRGLDSGADADGTALALSLGTGIVNRSALVEGLNNLPGLNQVEFGAEGGAEDTAATVSGYIGERIYLSYGVGLYEPINVLTARLYLYTRLWLEVVSRLESSVDLYYSWDID